MLNRALKIAIGDRTTFDGLEPIHGPLPQSDSREMCPSIVREKTTTVIVTLGQSNAANFARGCYQPHYDVVNFSIYDGNTYRAADPLIGASGDGGNFATRLGDVLIQRGMAERVLLAPIAMGNTRIEDWAIGGIFHQRILALIRRMYDARLVPDLILWQHGEGNVGDNDPGGTQYRRRLHEIVNTFRYYGIVAPFGIALCTLCGERHPNADHIREGQRTAAAWGTNTFLGPDTDLIGLDDRFDRCHMSELGAQRQAEIWADAIARRD